MKRGRPIKTDGRTEQVRVRLTKDEMETLRRIASETGESLSDVLRSAITDVYNKKVDEHYKKVFGIK